MVRRLLLLFFIFFALTSFKNSKIIEGFNFIYNESGLHQLCGYTEVTNKQYSEFLEHLKATNDTTKLKECRVYNELWEVGTYCRSLKQKWNRKTGQYEDVDSIYYLAKEYSTEKFQNFPVVNISHNAAKYYCEWLTEKWKEIYKARPSKYHGNSLIFRLPSESEWEKCAKGGLEFVQDTMFYPWGNGNYINYKGQYLANFMRVSQESFILQNDGRVILNPNDSLVFVENNLQPLPAISFPPNDYGLYCMAGNVAEMTDDYAICKGGSFVSIANSLKIQSSEIYPYRSPYKGFRVIADIYNAQKKLP